MLYVIVCLINGSPFQFHENLVENVCAKFNVKRQKLQAHFTIKAPFETDKLDEVEIATEEFCKNNLRSSFEINGYNHFKDRVVFMKIDPSNQLVKTCEDYVTSLKKIDWLDWKSNEKGNRIFHCTIVSKLPTGKFEAIWPYVNDFPCSFHCSFDNITIMRWELNKWIVHKSYNLKNLKF